MLEQFPLQWDAFNREHIARHDIKVAEVEIAYQDPKKLVYSTYNKRFICIGSVVKNRLITIILRRSNQSYYVVTARLASRKERKIYEQTNC